MTIEERVALYKQKFHDCRAIDPVRNIVVMERFYDVPELERLELLRKLNTELTALYMVSIPVITVWVRDDNYVQATGEIYLTEPTMEGFLHQFRHHLQNVERKYERRGLTAEGYNALLWDLPYKDTISKMYGEDDAVAWSRFVLELASK